MLDGVKYISVKDNASDYYLNIFTNEDNEIYVNGTPGEYDVEGDFAEVKTSGGTLSIPSNSIVNIISANAIIGNTNAYGYISAVEGINLMMRHSKKSYLILKSEGVIAINEEVVSNLDDFTNILQYRTIRDEYFGSFLKSMPKPITRTAGNETYTEFSSMLPNEIELSHVAAYADALYLYSPNMVNVYASQVKRKTKKIELNPTKVTSPQDKKIYNIHDMLLEQMLVENIDKSTELFEAWKHSVIEKRKSEKTSKEEKKRIETIRGTFDKDSFDKDPKDL